MEQGGGIPVPGVFVRVANKGVTGEGVRKSGRERTYRRPFLRFGAGSVEVAVGGPPPPGVFVRAESKGVTGGLSVRADSKGVRRIHFLRKGGEARKSRN